MKLANKANPFPRGIPRTYAELVAVFAPRVIHDRIEFENASAVMNAMAGHALNKEQEDYLETLAILVDEYDFQLGESCSRKSSSESRDWRLGTALRPVVVQNSC